MRSLEVRDEARRIGPDRARERDSLGHVDIPWTIEDVNVETLVSL